MVANAHSVTQGLEQKEEKRPRAFEKKIIKNQILKGAKSFRIEPLPFSLPVFSPSDPGPLAC